MQRSRTDSRNDLTPGARIAGISAIALLVFMLFGWYSVSGASGEVIEAVETAREQAEDLGIPQSGGGNLDEADTTLNAWKSFGLIDVVLFGAVVAGLLFAAARRYGAGARARIAPSALACGLGALAFVLVLYRLLDPPGQGVVERELGAFLGLFASAGVAIGGYIGMQEDGTSFAGERNRLIR